jgi:hypothetical protein
MEKLSKLLSGMSILTEANEDDLFDIDKEVDAQIKRVNNRLEKQNQLESETNPEDQQDKELSNPQQGEDVQESDIESEEVINDDQTAPPVEGNDPQQEDENQPESSEYKYMDNGSDESIPEDYEPKQSIPELKILSTLSDSEYALCNIKILEQFKELQNNVESTINNILMNVTTRNARQVQIVEIVHENLHAMLDDINTYILYRNNDIYEENVRTYLTYLKRYDIAMKLIKAILDENVESKNNEK